MPHIIHRYDTVESTMLTAAELAANGAPDGAVVVANRQTAGQGRLGRAWHSEPDAGLYFTLILRPTAAPETLPLVTMALGVATSEALREATGAATDLRWPNDVLIEDRKCAGILTQLTNGVVLAGIGVNVNHSAFPDDITAIATSLRIATGKEHSREHVLDAILARIDHWLPALFAGGKAEVLRAFESQSSYVRGRRVTVDGGDAVLTGVTDGLDLQGFLYLRDAEGRRIKIVAGGVRPAPEP